MIIGIVNKEFTLVLILKFGRKNDYMRGEEFTT